MSKEVWTEVYARLTELIAAHRTTLVFVNTRRMAERVARELTERLGEDAVTAHHGSMAKELRLSAEQRLKRGELKALVATASLELGIDIGDVNLVCQIGSPRSIATFLQRVGRSGHAIGATPKGRLFPLSRDDLAECARLSTACGAASLTALRFRRGRSTCSRSRLSPRSRRRTGRKRRSTTGCGAAGRFVRSRARTSTPSLGCWPRASPPATAGAARSSIATRSIAFCAAGAGRERRR